MSSNKSEAKARVLKLYKAWYRQIPFMSKWFFTMNFMKKMALSCVFVVTKFELFMMVHPDFGVVNVNP